MSDEQEKRLAQLKQAYDMGILDEDTYQSFLKEAQTKSGAIAQGEGATAVGERGVHVGGSVTGDVITGNVYHGRPTDNPQEALRIYRQVLAQSSGSLPLRGVDVGASDPTTGQNPLGLAQVYIDLDTRTQVDASEDEKKQSRQRGMPGERETRPLSTLEAAAANRQLVILGDPGGGKTTFVRHLAHCLAAHALYPDAGWLKHLPHWPPGESDALPIVVILRDFARSLPAKLPAKAEPGHLWKFIKEQLAAQNLDFAAPALQQTLQAGKALILLDGLDEIPTKAQRTFVRDAVVAFTGRHPGNRALITCRVLSYQDTALKLPEETFPDYELALFDEEKIDNFIAVWYKELARLGTVPHQDVDALTRKFQKAVRRPDLWRLAPNPLLLTVMALVHSHKGRLPDARALLYEETVDILLWRWEQIKAGGEEDAPQLRQLLQQAERTDMDLKKVLWQLAFEAHRQVDGDGDGDKLADIGELKLTKALAALTDGDWTWAKQVVTAMKLRAGLLLERAPELFTFPHRTFQEYLAGAHLSMRPDFARQGCQLAAQGTLWREVILLAVGRLVYRDGATDKPLALVGELCPAAAQDDADGWYKAWLAGDALLEVGLKQVRDSGLGRDLLARAQNRLAALLSGGKLTPRQRAAAGDTLARLGDPRRGVGVRTVNGATLPDIELCYVPPGPFWMGNDEDNSIDKNAERPPHQLDIPYGYWIGRYPVTVGQFKHFLTQSSYKGQYRREALEDPDNRPVRYLSWYDALAFCRWLDGVWRERGWLPEGMSVILPSEAEWEKAARGGLQIPQKPLRMQPESKLDVPDEQLLLIDNPLPQRRFPWGDDFNSERANGGATRIETTTAVGAFSGGVSPYGVWGMSGNVYDWTRSIWGKDYSESAYNYSYDAEDGREDLEKDDNQLRVIRGGFFGDDETWLLCSSRVGYFPRYGFNLIGFRLVASPFFTSGR
ncbi:MAG: SUMF1/EgtB/PvdO family nonheme iron enzyme [Chloroflexi bacterium]|nr:SUMF1/EgtB/PvdO family nonheme iron enzyme [Chloroflexota bacterium]